MPHIHHIATAADWSRSAETYEPRGWREEGFIHCATAEQLVMTANKHFPGRADLVLLTIDTDGLEALVVWEDTSGAGEDFPHIYGAIEVAAVVSAEPLAAGLDGTFDLWADGT